MQREFAKEHAGGATVEFGPCVVGQDIDVVGVRGFAPLELLALISAPDVFDDDANPSGTQRDLKSAHVKASFEYVTQAAGSAGSDVRAFPELILNVRNMLVVSIVDWVTGEELDFDSHSDV